MYCSPPVKPGHKRAAWQLEQEERGFGTKAGSIRPENSPPHFFQSQYFKNQLKQHYGVFSPINFENVTAKKALTILLQSRSD